ncbi:hypothetical protein GCM10011494_09250 [Novosphingobium endophyticum]|uniref:DUF2238 domain-containing protein n=1 Tax=Novosphingobium endophyticum TaxID=1955250 RepID=A0A916X3M4_9SPHN|nr:hypothetical protein [Novosphingobium endophyticum]GGB92991.1 hypothetical protein GCM10011494_09250 [Novosphingobium endophyticum]
MGEDVNLSRSATSGRIVRRVYLAVVGGLQLVMATELALLVATERWLHAFLVAGMMAAFLLPVLVRSSRRARIPAEVQILAILFIFASLFLGEVRDYYERIWWWDLALHATAGLLLGLLGFLIVYILNADEVVDLHMKPSFLALFAFFFAVGLGALWEIFEFAMDEMFGLTMQKPMLGDNSGLTDTMWDLIVDAAGAALMGLAGWRYVTHRRRSLIARGIRRVAARGRRAAG